MADDFGSHLRHQRELRGISLDEIASITKIHLRYLKALESNSFDELPGEVFIKGFIRSYGRAIGADLNELIKAYDESVGKERLETRQQAEKEGGSENQKQVFLVNAIVGGFLGLFILFAIWYLLQNPPQEASKKTTGTQQTKPQSSSADEAHPPAGALEKVEKQVGSEDTEFSDEKVSPPSKNDGEVSEGEKPAKILEKIKDDSEAEATLEKPKPTPSEADPQKPVAEKEKSAIIENQKAQQVQGDRASSSDPQSKEAKLKLQIRVSENAWFNIAVDGDAERDFILPAGELKEFEANDELVMTIGNKRGTELKLNGKELALPSTADNVVRNFKVNLKLIE